MKEINNPVLTLCFWLERSVGNIENTAVNCDCWGEQGNWFKVIEKGIYEWLYCGCCGQADN